MTSLHLVVEWRHLQTIRDKLSGLFRVSTMAQLSWQDDLVNVSKSLCERLDATPGADSKDQSETSDQP